MSHNNLHVDYYLFLRDDFKTRLFEAFPVFRHYSCITEQSDTGRRYKVGVG